MCIICINFIFLHNVQSMCIFCTLPLVYYRIENRNLLSLARRNDKIAFHSSKAMQNTTKTFLFYFQAKNFCSQSKNTLSIACNFFQSHTVWIFKRRNVCVCVCTVRTEKITITRKTTKYKITYKAHTPNRSGIKMEQQREWE